MSSAMTAPAGILVENRASSGRRWPSLSVGGRIYALCLGLILITVGVATLGYLGLAGQGQSLHQYIRVSEATKSAVNVGYEFTRVRRHVAVFAETGGEDEIKFLHDHNKLAMDAIMAADSRIAVEDRKIMIRDIADKFKLFEQATEDLIGLRKDLELAAASSQEAFAALSAAHPDEPPEASRPFVPSLACSGSAPLCSAVSMSPTVYKGYQDYLPTVAAALRPIDGSEAGRSIEDGRATDAGSRDAAGGGE